MESFRWKNCGLLCLILDNDGRSAGALLRVRTAKPENANHTVSRSQTQLTLLERPKSGFQTLEALFIL